MPRVKNSQHVEIAIIGAGIAGIAAAYYLCVENRRRSVLLIDSRRPMSYTSAQSGDNYRNWWPHPTMTAFTNDSIDELDRLARDSDNVFNMTRGGYVLATRRADVADVVEAIPGAIDIDVISERSTLRETFPALSEDIRNVLHIRRGGDFSSQQLAQYMLEKIRDAGGSRLRGHVTDVSRGQRYALELLDRNSITADIVVNAAGPFVGDIGQMLDVDLALTNVFQQKVAFEDQPAGDSARHAILDRS